MPYFLIMSFLSTILYSSDFFDYNSSLISKDDLKLMQSFDKTIYKLSDEKIKTLDLEKIFNFIDLHKQYITDYSLAKIDLKASAGIDDYDYSRSNLKRDKNFKQISINLEYPLFDEKTKKNIKNKKMEYKLKILNEIENFINIKNKFIGYTRELKFNRLIQIKEKLQVKKGVKYLDEKLNTTKKILDLQNKILESKSKLKLSELTLLNYVKRKYRPKLKEILK